MIYIHSLHIHAVYMCIYAYASHAFCRVMHDVDVDAYIHYCMHAPDACMHDSVQYCMHAPDVCACIIQYTVYMRPIGWRRMVGRCVYIIYACVAYKWNI
jgi:hypothetical protein